MSKKMDSRNLTKRGRHWYLNVMRDGVRLVRATEQTDLAAAVRVRDAWEHQNPVGGFLHLEAPTFCEAAKRYEETKLRTLKVTTRQDRTGQLKRLVDYFGSQRLNAIRKPALIDWWEAEIIGKGRSVKTGRNYLDPLAGIFRMAVHLELIDSHDNPVPGFREYLAEEGRTAQGRAANQGGAHVNPFTAPEMKLLVEASQQIGGMGHVALMLMLDAGLRFGEAVGLQWSSVEMGTGPDDRSRHLHIRHSRSRERRDLDTPKSGRSRKVALSRRLRLVLRDEWMRQGQPASGDVCLLDKSNYRKRHWADALEAAEIGDSEVGSHTPKDLRDTYASQLITCGVPLKYVSRQLGHSNTQVTERHYAKYLVDEGDDYRDPMPRLEGEVPADFLARLYTICIQPSVSENRTAQNHE
jgi:integrase